LTGGSIGHRPMDPQAVSFFSFYQVFTPKFRNLVVDDRTEY